LPVKDFRFAHGAVHRLDSERVLVNSYHCSRYNTQTRRLTTEMFEAVVGRAQALAVGANGAGGARGSGAASAR
jgi:uracil-DNA glycosylase